MKPVRIAFFQSVKFSDSLSDYQNTNYFPHEGENISK